MAEEIEKPFKLSKFSLAKYYRLCRRGLTNGMGEPDGPMCIEAVICNVLGLPHDDNPQCVDREVRNFKITLNDSSSWPSQEHRAHGLYDLGLAQLGSRGKFDSYYFLKLLWEKFASVMVPKLIAEIMAGDICYTIDGTLIEERRKAEVVALAEKLKNEPNMPALTRLGEAIGSLPNFSLQAKLLISIHALFGGSGFHLAKVAVIASFMTGNPEYLYLAAKLALSVLRKLKSPGCRLIPKAKRLPKIKLER